MKTALEGLLNENPNICCGYKTNILEKDLILFNQTKNEYLTEYNGTSSILLDKNKVWITGGDKNYPFSTSKYKTSEFFFSNLGPVEGPKLPRKISRHSMVKVDSKNIYMIGGQWPLSMYMHISDKTWIVDPTKDFEFKAGPSMKKTGYLIGCATLSMNGKVIIVAAKSSNLRKPNRLDWVEYLDTSNPTNGWKIGK